jgi:hypothetical protein
VINSETIGKTVTVSKVSSASTEKVKKESATGKSIGTMANRVASNHHRTVKV